MNDLSNTFNTINFSDPLFLNLIAWAIVGIAIGFLMPTIIRRDARGGTAPTLFISIIGALIGGFIGAMVNNGGLDRFVAESLIGAAIGALVGGLIQRVSSRPVDHIKTTVGHIK